jgi:tartrate dehydrogenase/decarboxylase/D-malate dehydrogenase
MMLEHLGEQDAADAVLQGIEKVLANGPRTPDMRGKSSTREVGEAIAAAV